MQPIIYKNQPFNGSPKQAATQRTRKRIENYTYGLQDQIGNGYSSTVFKGWNEHTHEPVAIKVIDLQMLQSPVHHQLLQSEIDALQMLNHPNILKLYNVFQTQNNTYLVTEFCDGGDLASKILKGKQTEQYTRQLMLGVFLAYKEIRRRGIIHRDLKPANILLNNGIPKIGDFGFALTPNSPPMLPSLNVGSPLYMSPQAMKQNKFNQASDIWALGVTIYELLFGAVPWQATSESELAQKTLTIPVSFPQGTKISDECIDLIRRCLTVDENKRITIDQIDDHIWVSGRKSLNTPTSINQPQQRMTFHSHQGPLQTSTNREQQYFMQTNTRMGKENQNDVSRGKSLSKNEFSIHQPKVIKSPTSHDQSNMSFRMSEGTLSQNEARRNDSILLSQIHFCRYLFRISDLLCRVNVFTSQFMKEKLLFFVYKNIMLKTRRLVEAINYPATNTYSLVRFKEYSQTQQYKRIAQNIYNQENQINNYFSNLWINLQQFKQILQSDTKFDAIFDENLTEFESFYIILHSFLRVAINELQLRLEESLRVRFKDLEQQLPPTYQDGVVLLDYLITYYQLSALILDSFNQHEIFAQQSMIEQIADGKPVKLTYGHFVDIGTKIKSLHI